MDLDTTKLRTTAANLADFGASLKDRHTSADPALWKDMGAAFCGIAEAIDELTATENESPRPRRGATDVQHN